MPEQLSQTPPPVDAELAGWQGVADQMHEWHPALQKIAKGHLEKHGIETPAEQYHLVAIELGQEALIDAMHTSSEQEDTPEALTDLLQQADEHFELWRDSIFLGKVNAQVIGKAKELSDKKRLSSGDLKELKELGILADVDEGVVRDVYENDITPGSLVYRLTRGFSDGYLGYGSIKSIGLQAHPQLLLERISKTLSVLEGLHEHDPTAARDLYEQFGIGNFGRYTLRQLIDQLELTRGIEQGGEKPQSIIVVATATEDHNDGLDNGSLQVEHQNVAQARKTDQRVPPVVFIEVGFVSDLRRKTTTLAKKIAPISTLFINAHGNEDDVYLSSQEGGSLSYGNMLIADSLKETLTPGAEVVLQACSTGAENGVAEQLSKSLDRPVYASSLSVYGNSEPFAFEQDEHGDWHYEFGFKHSDKQKHLEAGHVYGLGNPDTRRSVKGHSRPSFISRINHRRRATKQSARKFSVHD